MSLGAVVAAIAVDDIEEKVELLVVENNILKVDIITGRTFIDKPNISFMKTNDKIVFGYKINFPFKDIAIKNDGSKKKFKLKLAGETVIISR